MKLKLMWFLLAVIAIGGALAGTLRATPASGFSGTTLATARFDELDLNSHTLPANFWQARLKTQGLSDLYVQSNLLHCARYVAYRSLLLRIARMPVGKLLGKHSYVLQ